MADLASKEAAGETVTKKRKERSDKGAVKGPRRKTGANDEVEESDDAVARLSKRRKAATKSKGTAKGNEVVESDDAVTGPSKRRKAATKSKGAKGNGKAKGKENRQSIKSSKSWLPNFIVGSDEEDDEEDEML
jgi:hypothetical protein